MLCYKCNQRFINSLKFKKHIQILAFRANGAMENEYQHVYGALEENKNLTEQI